MRKPTVKGKFYPGEKEELEREVKSFLNIKRNKEIKACIVPHAGYVFSGKTAGKVFSSLPEKKIFIMLGVNHSGFGKKVCFSLEDFSTPLGIVKNNKELGKKIIEKLKTEEINIEVNENVHKYEHSLEVELPFLQLSQKNFEIVPVIFRSLRYEESRKIAEVLSEFLDDKTLIIVSSDFTHYGFSYGFVPFEKPEKNFEAYDTSIIKEILKPTGRGFYDKASRGTICGIYGIAVLIELGKIKKWKGKLIDYSTSSDVSGDWSSVVGYAGIVFE